jgi:4-hydroxy-tetrahydrodipicolinate synthase
VILDRSSYRGIYVIVVTPFTDALDIDEAGLRATVRFCLAAGVDGLVSPANASEVGYLSDVERRRVAAVVVEEAAGRVPVIVGVSAAHARLSAAFAADAEAIGADGVMAMPPTFHPATADEIRGFYREVGAASSLPLVLQNAVGLGATVMSPALMAEILAAVPTARFVKEETAYPAQTAGALVVAAGADLWGVMGGQAGKTLLEELPHGVCGTMPACEYADLHVALWQAIAAGDGSRTRRVFRHLLPLLVFEGAYGIPVCKEVLKARGVIASAAWRQTGYRPLDPLARAELRTLLDDAAEFMTPGLAPLR